MPVNDQGCGLKAAGSNLADFKADGVLLLRNFVGESQLASWRAQPWEHLAADPDDAHT